MHQLLREKDPRGWTWSWSPGGGHTMVTYEAAVLPQPACSCTPGASWHIPVRWQGSQSHKWECVLLLASQLRFTRNKLEEKKKKKKQFQCLPVIKNVWKVWDSSRNQNQYTLEEFHADLLKRKHHCPETDSFTQCAKSWARQSRGIGFIFSSVHKRVVGSKSTKPAYWLSKLSRH